MTEKYKEGRSKRINHIAQEIRETVDNGGKIWKIKRKLEKKVQALCSITNTEGINWKTDQIYKKIIQDIIKHYLVEPENQIMNVKR